MKEAIISLVSVTLGWFLAQGSDLVKGWISNARLKNSLLQELEDLKEELKRTSLIYERKLQIYSLKGIEPSVPLKLSNYFFNNYYKDIFAKLNREQRLSYQLIHSHISSLNKGFDELARVTSKCQESSRSKVVKGSDTNSIEKSGSYIIAQYKNVMDVLWHIEHHLRNPRKPDLSLFEKTHDNYLQFQTEVDKNINDIIAKAKDLQREDF